MNIVDNTVKVSYLYIK